MLILSVSESRNTGKYELLYFNDNDLDIIHIQYYHAISQYNNNVINCKKSPLTLFLILLNISYKSFCLYT